MEVTLYPLKFETIFKDKIWGGSKIKDVLGKDYSPLSNCGETWELSGVKDNISIVSNGELKGSTLTELIERFESELVGNKIYDKYGNKFPLLVKFLDAEADLSIQVHPNDEQAKKYDSFGKTEMWYIIEADPGAQLIAGFNRDLTKEEFIQRIKEKNISEVLNREEVNADDAFFIPAGEIHTIGKGILLCEIQRSSDVTFRVYDFDRKDAEGNKRELHIAQAVEVINYDKTPGSKTHQPLIKNEITPIADCPYFTTNRLLLDKEMKKDYSGMDSFVIYVCLEGASELIYDQGKESMKKGDLVLLPAAIKNVSIDPNQACKLLECYVK